MEADVVIGAALLALVAAWGRTDGGEDVLPAL